MDQQLEKALHIRYIKLHFTVSMLENTKLPRDKVSALRGGMGEMLLQANCISDQNCAKCAFEPECIVRRTMYSRYEMRPKFVTTSDSIGYLLECENYEENFCEGDLLQFNLILFGKSIIHFNQYIQAFRDLGKRGVGKKHSKYQIVLITDTRRRKLVAKVNDHMSQYPILTLGEYAEYRLNQIQEDGCKNKLMFQTPLTLKYNGVFLDVFHMEAIWNAVRRRIYMLECYEGIKPNIYDYDKLDENRLPVIMEQVCKDACIKRYSSTQHKKMTLWGIKGYIELDAIPEDMLLLLAAGELTHIGKNTSFDFGRYRII